MTFSNEEILNDAAEREDREKRRVESAERRGLREERRLERLAAQRSGPEQLTDGDYD